MIEVYRYGQRYDIPDEVVHIPDKCTIDFKAHRITISGGREEKLTSKFLILLAYFYMNKNAFLSPNKILDYMFPPQTDKGSIDQIKTMILHLRKKLNDTQPYTIIVEERDFGYKFVLDPEGRVSIEKSTEGKAPSAGLSDGGASNQSNRKPTKKPETRSEHVVSNLKISLERLVQASSISQINEARLRINRAIKLYVDEISFPYFIDISNYDDGSGWQVESREHDRWLIRAINYCRAELETTEQDSELLDIKKQLLYDIAEWHILVEMLGAQLSLEREAFELSGSLIGKETRQSRIDKLEEDYKNAQASAEIATTSLEESISGYNQSLSGDKPSI